MPLVAHVLDDVEPEELEFQFGNGSVALDLVATVGERWGRCFERLRSSSDLRRWLQDQDLIGATAVTDEDVRDYRRLRSAIFDLVQARRENRRPSTGPLRVVNRAAKSGSATARLTTGWSIESTSADAVGAAAAAIATDAIVLLATTPPSRIRECAADDCARLFVDRSRPGRRRWCESATGCGNRAKVAAYRKRQETSVSS